MQIAPNISRAAAGTHLASLTTAVTQMRAELPSLEPSGYASFGARFDAAAEDAAQGALLVSAALGQPLRPIAEIPEAPADMTAGEELLIGSVLLGGGKLTLDVALSRGVAVDKSYLDLYLGAALEAAQRGTLELGN
ncbi:MAG: hypothetical protein JWO69_275 [Thermoleophilia bacterium]|jgi:hypothetical protein|nr:hypothetical protein [Thermoleophilia bacterium]